MTPLETRPLDVPMSRVAITGASGFLGSALAASLQSEGMTVHRMRRADHVAPPDIAWQPSRGFVDVKALEGVDVVINLAGEPIAQLWTEKRKAAIRDSRVMATSLLAQSLAQLTHRPRALLSGSAIGIYGNRGQEELDESSSVGSDFLAATAEDWERAAAPASEAGVRVVSLRTGIVLGSGGGALGKMLVPFKLGLGGRVGSGEQWMSWIGREDWVRAVRFLLSDDRLSGSVNLVAPNPVPNAEFARTLARVLGRPALGRLPAVLVSSLLGEMGRSTLLASQRVRPRRLMEADFEFTHPTLEQCLRAVLATPSAA